MPIFVGVLCLHEKKTFQKYKQKLVICVRFSGFTDGKIIGGEKMGWHDILVDVIYIPLGFKHNRKHSLRLVLQFIGSGTT